jgi:hypothetical protein
VWNDLIQLKLSHIPFFTHDVISHHQLITPWRNHIGQKTQHESKEWDEMQHVHPVEPTIIPEHSPHIEKGKRTNQIEKAMCIGEKRNDGP